MFSVLNYFPGFVMSFWGFWNNSDTTWGDIWSWGEGRKKKGGNIHSFVFEYKVSLLPSPLSQGPKSNGQGPHALSWLSASLCGKCWHTFFLLLFPPLLYIEGRILAFLKCLWCVRHFDRCCNNWCVILTISGIWWKEAY